MLLIIKTCCDVFGVTWDEMRGRGRHAELALARQTAMALCRKHTRASFNEIGAAFCRDHGTVLWAIKAIEARRATDKRYASDYSLVNQAVDAAISNQQ